MMRDHYDEDDVICLCQDCLLRMAAQQQMVHAQQIQDLERMWRLQ